MNCTHTISLLFLLFSSLYFHFLYQWADQWPEPCPPQRRYWCCRRGCRDSSAIGDGVVRNRDVDNDDDDDNDDEDDWGEKTDNAWDKQADTDKDDLSGGMCAQLCVSVALVWTKKVGLKINFFLDHRIAGWVGWAQVFIMASVPVFFFTGSNICFIIFFLSSFS